MPATQFSPALRQELAIALNEFMADPDRGQRRLTSACDRVCTESHELHATADEMSLGLRKLYAEMPGGGEAFTDQRIRHLAFDEFLSGCVAAFRDAEARALAAARNAAT